MNRSNQNRRGRLVVAGVRLAAMLVVVLFLAMWIHTLRRSGDDPSILDRDWVAFYRAGQLMVEGRWLEIYPGSFSERYPFPYPPFFMYICGPLGWLPPLGAYGACVAGSVLALFAAFRVLSRWLPGRPSEHVTAALVVLASAPWLGILVVGQFCSWYVLALAAGFATWQRGRPITAGIILSLLLCKPNIGVVVAVAVIAMGGWRVATGLAIGLAALVVSSLPLGLAMWREYFAASAKMADLVRATSMDLWKHQTLYAFWGTVLGPKAPVGWTRLAWGITLLPMGVGAMLVWRRRPVPRRLARVLSVIVLGLVACTPYLYFYDGLLLMLPGIVWYVQRDDYAVRRCHQVAGWCLLGIYLWQHLSLFVLKAYGHLALTGLGVSVWYVAEVYDLVRGCSATGPSTDDGPGPSIGAG